jgi:two-component system, cell cycle sensor histidine kinase and response regulator CckA
MTAEPNTGFDPHRMHLLERVSRALEGAADYQKALRVLAEAPVPELADMVVVVVPSDNGSRPQVVATHVNPQVEPAVLRLIEERFPALGRLAARHLVRGRDFVWLPQVTRTSLRLLGDEPDVIELIRGLGLRSLMVVPLRSQGEVCGALAFSRTRESPFQAADLALAQILSRRVTVALEMARIYGRSMEDEAHRVRLEAAVQKWVRVFAVAGWGAAIVEGPDNQIQAVNPAFARLHGYADVNALSGRRYSDLLPSDQMEEIERWPEMSGEPPAPYESMHVRADGTKFPVLTDVTPLDLGSGAESFVVTVQDMTELKRAEERLLRAQRLEAVGRLAGGVAHEVNNMMTIILGFSDLLARSPGFPDERQREVEEIRKAAARAGKTTQQLLAFSRQQILQPTNLHMHEVVADLAPMLRLLLPANVVLETTISPAGALVHVDRGQLEQVLINLAFNARDAMPGGGTLRLVTDSRWLSEEDGRRLIGIAVPPGSYATISVVDTGTGMDSATMNQLFEPFFTTKPVGSGTGLGLATVYGIVKQSGGYIWVESSVGMGTTFTICLPQVHEPTRSKAQTPLPSRQSLPLRSRPGTVLVVEDEEGVRDLARRVLEQDGHRVLEARDGPDAMQVIAHFSEELDLVVSDVIVPDIASSELEHELHRRRPDLSILYMSGYSLEEVLGRGLIPSDALFLQKPFTGDELLRLVAQQLESGGRTVTT